MCQVIIKLPTHLIHLHVFLGTSRNPNVPLPPYVELCNVNMIIDFDPFYSVHAGTSIVYDQTTDVEE